MNAALFDSALAAALGDPSGAVYSAGARQAAAARAVQAYSQYLPAMRRFGTGNIFGSVAAGATAVEVVGGVFLQGTQVTLDPWTGSSETLTIAAAVVGSSSLTEQTAPLTQLTFTAPLASAHSDGAFVTAVQPGLSLVAGQDTYYLPSDWQRVDQDSFDLATGVKSAPQKGNGFYDASYDIIRQLSGVGWGGASNYGPTSYWGLPSISTPFTSSGQPIASGAGYTVYRILDGSAVPLLVISPAPPAAALLDFYYFGCHTVSSVPVCDQDAILSYAKYAALSSQVAAWTAAIDQTAGDEQDHRHFTMDSTSKAAAACLADFEKRIRFRPFGTSG